jgi:hypothetical protein
MAKRIILVLLTAVSCFGQNVGQQTPHIVWPKSAVTVVFAPEHRQDVSKPVEFAAPKGAVGIRVEAASAIATAVIIGDDGKRHMECAWLPEVLRRLKPAVGMAHSVKVANDK